MSIPKHTIPYLTYLVGRHRHTIKTYVNVPCVICNLDDIKIMSIVILMSQVNGNSNVDIHVPLCISQRLNI